MVDRLRINRPDVLHQVIEGEVIVLNLGTGCYFSMNEVGAEIWGLISGNPTLDEIVLALSRRYTAPPDMAQVVGAWVGELEAEGLVEREPGPATAARGGEGAEVERKALFQAPALQKYTDMQDFLALDPVQEVVDDGWPQPGPPLAAGRAATLGDESSR
jgi:hypothetical protein